MKGPIAFPALHEERLENGAAVVVARKAGVPLVAVRLMIHAGSASDPRGHFGMANLVTETARRGTQRRSGAGIDEEIEAMGAELGSGADEDASHFGLSAPVELFPKLLDVLLDVVMNPSFPQRELSRICRRERAALVHDLDEPSVVADRAMQMMAYGAHPYGHPVEGRRAHLAAVKRADVVGFHKRWYDPTLATLVVVGAVDPKEVMARARSRLRGWRSAAVVPPAIPTPSASTRTVYVVDRPDLSQSQVRIAVPSMARASPEYFSALVANSILGGGFTSRLMESIRVNRGLSYGVSSRFVMNLVGGLFFVSTFTKEETTAEITRVALDEVARFCDEGPTAEELDRVQGYLCGLFPLALETHEQLADKICDLKLHGFPLEDVTEYRERIRSVNAEQCRQVARRHFPHERGVVVVVGPAKKVARSLERFGPVTVMPVGRIL